MNIQWVISDNFIPNSQTNIQRMKDCGAFWGSFKTWRQFGTDNVVCHDMSSAEDLIKRAVHAACNLYISNSTFDLLNRPKGVKLYEGNFMNHDVDNQDELIAMNLAASICDVILLMGFDLGEKPKNSDKFQQVKDRNYQGLICHAIKSTPHVQWILIDHPSEVNSELVKLPNLDRDSLDNVFELLKV